MSRYRSFDQNDDTPNHMGDVAIWGVKMRQEAHLVPPGYAAEAVNMRFRRGVPETRLGTHMPPWAHRPDEEEEVPPAPAPELLNIVITNQEEVDVTLTPDGTLVDQPTWTLVGARVPAHCTFIVAENGLSAVVRSPALPGLTEILVECQTVSPPTPPGIISTLLRVRVTPGPHGPPVGGHGPGGPALLPAEPPAVEPRAGTPATDLGASAGTPRPKTEAEPL